MTILVERNSNVDCHNPVIEKEEMDSKTVSNGVFIHNSPSKSDKKFDMKKKRQKSKNEGKNLQGSGKDPNTIDDGWKMRTISPMLK